MCKETSKLSLPVIIVGAGPCGLVAAMTLQNNGVPFVIVEKASREKLCSNAGSGFDLSETTIAILKDRLDLPLDGIFIEYSAMHLETMQGKKIRSDRLNDLKWGSVNRADLQVFLLERLFPTPDSEDGVLKCGVGIESYEEDTAKEEVTVKMADGTSIVGKILLGCDGINSKIRECMHGGEKTDPLQFCDILCYWGKTPMPKDSDLAKEMGKNPNFKAEEASFVITMAAPKAPGCFYCVPTNGQLVWAFFVSSKEPPKTGDDQTRRGGLVLDAKAMEELRETIRKLNIQVPYLDILLDYTDPSEITLAGLFDRKNRNLPFSSQGKLVALLGDAAHPQTPFSGQGANMAITDAYVLATRLAQPNTTAIKAVNAYDNPKRKKGVNAVISAAHRDAKMSMSSNFFISNFVILITKYSPMQFILSEINSLDKSNAEFLKAMEEELSINNGKK